MIDDKKVVLYRKIIIIILGILYLLIAIIRAASMAMTYDEGYTYVTYVRPFFDNFQDYFHIFIYSKANNHLLNTFLIILIEAISHVSYNEFLIRLPVLIFAAIFVAVLSRAYLTNNVGFLEYVMLIGNAYLNEFFSLARGYSIAAVFILICMLYLNKYNASINTKHRSKYILIMCFTLSMAELSNTVSLLPAFAVYVFVFIDLIVKKEIKSIIGDKYFCRLIAPLIFLNVCCLFYHIVISLDGRPLYVSRSSMFESVYMGYTGMITSNKSAQIVFALLICIIPLAAVIINGIKNVLDTEYIFTYLILACVILLACIHKGYPCGRTLLPLYPVMIFALCQSIRIIGKKISLSNKKVTCLKIAFLLCICFGFSRHISYTVSTDWAFMADDKIKAYSLMRDGERMPVSDEFLFYAGQIKYYYNYDLTEK